MRYCDCRGASSSRPGVKGYGNVVVVIVATALFCPSARHVTGCRV